jgi:hypothetical protein
MGVPALAMPADWTKYGRANEKEKALPDLKKTVETVKASTEAKAVAQMSNASNYTFRRRRSC